MLIVHVLHEAAAPSLKGVCMRTLRIKSRERERERAMKELLKLSDNVQRARTDIHACTHLAAVIEDIDEVIKRNQGLF